MPDPLVMFKAMALAFLASACTFSLLVWRKRSSPAWVSLGWTVGFAAGTALGLWQIGIRPSWPPLEDRDRLLLLVLPAAVAAEFAAMVLSRKPLAWLLRLFVLGLSARVLLHQSSYLADLSGPGTREWSPRTAPGILAGIATAQCLIMVALDRLATRAPGASHALALAITLLGASLTVMLSGYATAGEIGLSPALAVAGAAIAAGILAGRTPSSAPIALGAVTLSALLVMGRFFGQLSTTAALLLAFAPLAAWFGEFPPLARLGPRPRAGIRIGLVTLIVAVVVSLAAQNFAQTSHGPAQSPTPEPSLEDYLNYGR